MPEDAVENGCCGGSGEENENPIKLMVKLPGMQTHQGGATKNPYTQCKMPSSEQYDNEVNIQVHVLLSVLTLIHICGVGADPRKLPQVHMRLLSES